MQGILEIHQVRPEYIDIIKSDNWLCTFDDGLYSQYLHCKDIAGAYFFINPTIINHSKKFISDIDCSQAHNLASKGDFSAYMSIDQIKELAQSNVIGLHGYRHTKFTDLSAFKYDFELGSKFFKVTFGFEVTAYCFPYNHIPQICASYLESLGITVFGGVDCTRIPIEQVKYGKNNS